MIGHYRITLLGRTAEQKSTRLVRFHAPEGADVLVAAQALHDTLRKVDEAKRLQVTRVTIERIDANGRVV